MARIGDRGEMEAFVRSVELGGFSAAARELKLSPSALSKLVSRLESALRVRLLSRTTRKLTPTPEGKLFLARCRRILAEMEDAENEVGRARERPRGPIARGAQDLRGRTRGVRFAEIPGPPRRAASAGRPGKAQLHKPGGRLAFLRALVVRYAGGPAGRASGGRHQREQCGMRPYVWSAGARHRAPERVHRQRRHPQRQPRASPARLSLCRAGGDAGALSAHAPSPAAGGGDARFPRRELRARALAHRAPEVEAPLTQPSNVHGLAPFKRRCTTSAHLQSQRTLPPRWELGIPGVRRGGN